VIPVAGLGEILRHEKLDDGRYMIWILGVSRVHIHEVECETPYRQVEVLPFLETVVPEPEAEDLTRELRDAAAARLKEPLPLPDSTPPGLLADLLMQTLQASRELVERVFVEPDVQARAQLVLREAELRGALDESEDPKLTVQIDHGSAPDSVLNDLNFDLLDDCLPADDDSSPQFPDAPPVDDGPEDAAPDEPSPDDDCPDDSSPK
jgi:hypothetical protein